MSGDKDKGKTNWDPFLRHSSALGILKPDIVFDVFNMAHQLPQPRVVRTAHDDEGTSVFASDELVTPQFPLGPRASALSTFDSRSSVPVSNTGPRAAAPADSSASRCPPAGVVFALSDFPPNYAAPMRRTLSLDYAAVLSGEIVLRLDGGDEKTIRAGEFVVQQGANHEWINRAAEPCRILFVMVGAEKVALKDGTVLEETK